MKSVSFATCALMLCVSTVALPQAETHKPLAQRPDSQQAPAELAFDRLKTLAGNWKGQAAMAAQPGMEIAKADVNPRETWPVC